jgi:hypothetical protein
MSRLPVFVLIVASWLALAALWMNARGEDPGTFLNAQLSLPMWAVLLKLLVVFALVARRVVRRANRNQAADMPVATEPVAP